MIYKKNRRLCNDALQKNILHYLMKKCVKVEYREMQNKSSDGEIYTREEKYYLFRRCEHEGFVRCLLNASN